MSTQKIIDCRVDIRGLTGGEKKQTVGKKLGYGPAKAGTMKKRGGGEHSFRRSRQRGADKRGLKNRTGKESKRVKPENDQ